MTGVTDSFRNELRSQGLTNTNTNYNSETEAKDNRHGMGEIARYLGGLLVEAGRERAPALVR